MKGHAKALDVMGQVFEGQEQKLQQALARVEELERQVADLTAEKSKST